MSFFMKSFKKQLSNIFRIQGNVREPVNKKVPICQNECGYYFWTRDLSIFEKQNIFIFFCLFKVGFGLDYIYISILVPCTF